MSKKQPDTWREKNIIQHVLKAQARSLKSKPKIKLSKQQKEQLLGVGNLAMVDNNRQRTQELMKVKPEVKDKYEIVQLFQISDRGTEIFPEIPTRNYIRP
jgi:hypothetical protein